MADYDNMTASEVIADQNGPGYIHPDTGKIWDGEKFVMPDDYYDETPLPPRGDRIVGTDGLLVATALRGNAIAAAKKQSREEYLRSFRGRVELRMQELQAARDRLDSAIRDLEEAERNADRWYRE